MQKVVILSAFLSPFRSGAEACAEEVSLLLSDHYDITIVTARLRSDLPKDDLLQGTVPIKRIGLGLPIDKWLFPFLAPFAVRALKPDLLHAVLETFAGLALMFCGTHYKRLLTCQTTNRSLLKGPIVRSADKVTVISSALKEIVCDLGRNNAVLIPNGIHVQKFEEARNTYQKVPGRILFVGRLEKMKGVDTLLQAFSCLLNQRDPESGIRAAELRIVGDGSQRITLEKLSHDLGVNDRVTFVGNVPSDQIYKEYAEATVFCGLSRSEALGNVFIEAQAGGCIVVATDVGGIKDTVPEDQRLPLNAPLSDIAEALARALTDKKYDQAIKNAEQYDWKIIAQKYQKVYESLL